MTAEADCLDCPGGTYCATQGLTNYTDDCSAGFYCSIGAINDSPTDGTTGDECPPGHYCPVRSPTPIPCPDGESQCRGIVNRKERVRVFVLL